jgi:hypothetical protein
LPVRTLTTIPLCAGVLLLLAIARPCSAAAEWLLDRRARSPPDCRLVS